MIGFDFMMFTVAFLRVVPFLDSLVNMYVLGLGIQEDVILILGIWMYFIVGSFFFRALNYLLADRVIKSKRLRERIGLRF